MFVTIFSRLLQRGMALLSNIIAFKVSAFTVSIYPIIITLCLILSSSSVALSDTIAAPSQLQVNLGPMPFDVYDNTHNASAYFPTSCPANTTVRSCIQTLLSYFRSQSVSGVRFQFAFCGGANSTALTNCGSYNPPYSLNQSWIANVNNFFADVHAAQISNVTITPAHTGFGGDSYAYGPPSSSPSGTLCADTQPQLLYWAAAPFGENYVCDSSGRNCGYRPTGAFDNSAYNCSSKNPIFVGWQNLYNVVNATLGAAAANGLTVFELDAENEADYLNFPVHARYLNDNAHTDTADNTDSVNALRYYMGTANPFDAGRVTTSSVTDNTNTAGWNCTNVYGDYARLMALDEFASAIGGGMVGLPSGYDASTGLVCGGTTSGMYQMPVSHTQPDIVDIHSYACVINLADPNGACFPDDSQAQNEAQINFSDVVHYLGLLNVQSSRFMLGET